MERSFKIGIIDAGSNSIKLQIVGIKRGSYAVIDEYKVAERIGDDCFRTGYITGESKKNLLKAFISIKKIIELNEADAIKAVGTAVFRDAKNKEEIVSEIKKTCGINLDIISGKEEARLSYLAVSSSFNLEKLNSLIVDIGGGSGEITAVNQGKILKSASTALGCSRLKNDFLGGCPPYNLEISEMKAFISKKLDGFKNISPDVAFCTGGTVNNLADVCCSINNKKPDSRINYVSKLFLEDFINANKNSSADDMKKIKAVNAYRADIIITAAIILYEIITYFRLEGFYSFTGGLRKGLLIDELNKRGIIVNIKKNNGKDYKENLNTAGNGRFLFNEHKGEGDEGIIFMLTEIGNKFNFDEKHAKQVAFLSGRLFSALEETYGIAEEYLKYLVAAAMLHDIGNFVSFSKHHKHSLYLIKNIDLEGFSDYEKAIIANIARYHRKSLPKKNHDIYNDIKEGDIDSTMKLASILRIADALDREHRGNVTNIKSVAVTDKSITVNLVYERDIPTETEAFYAKKDLMEKITGKQVDIKTT